jgi:16S rRNA (cytosine967-C5)-methyltransferase
MISPARMAALDALLAIERGADLPAALATTRHDLTDERDRGLAAAIVTGTLRWRLRLDFVLSSALRRPLDKLDVEVRETLRLSVFQLLLLDRVPASAVVDDAVSLTRRMRKGSASGFVNAVLRGLSRRRAGIVFPSPPAAIGTEADRTAAIEALSVSGSHPRWLVARWVDRLGLEAAARWIAFNNDEPPITLRVNRARLSREALAERLRAAGVETAPTAVAPDGLIVTAGNPLRAPLADTGDFLIQDEASQIVPLALGARPGDRVWDACAAPGGKTLVLADAMAHSGVLVAGDLRPHRLALLRRLLSAHGTDARLVRYDLLLGAPFGAAFDRVLVDAPCTGLGTLRRDVDIRWRRQEGDVEVAAMRQEAMLREAAPAVAPGGRLVYATCSSEPEENASVAERFLATHGTFHQVPKARLVADGVGSDLINQSGWLETRPDRHRLECFFAAAFQRDE